MIAYYIMFFFILVYALGSFKLTVESKRMSYFFVGAMLILFAGLRGPDVDLDNKAYLYLYNKTLSIQTLLSNPTYFFKQLKYEPSILIIFSIAKSVFANNGFQVAILLFAFISIGLKMKAISNMTEFLPYSILLFFSSTYLLQDFTQIRAAVASSFLLLSIPAIVSRDLKKFSICIILALFFHYSAVIFAPLYFLNTKKIDKLLYLSIIGVSILLAIMSFTPFDFLTKFDLGIYSEKIDAYLIGQKWEKREINIFNFSILLQIVISIFFLFFAEKTENKHAVILTKIYVFGIAVFYLFSSSPVIAFRLSDMLNVVQVILIPYILYSIKPKFVAEAAIIFIAVLFFLNQILVNPILHPYKTFLCQ